MSPWLYPVGVIGAAGGVGGPVYEIARSLRFNIADTAYLARTPGVTGNRLKWTYSLWLKRSVFNALTQVLLGGGNSTNDEMFLAFHTDETLRLVQVTGGGTVIDVRTTALFRDPTAWLHLVVIYDTAQATASDRIKFYVNGVRLTSFVTATYPASTSTLSNINGTAVHQIGRRPANADYYFGGYLAEIRFIDGQANDPSAFGEVDATTRVWGPKAYVGSYGTTGFYLKFDDNSNTTAATLGHDDAQIDGVHTAANDWTPNNFSVAAGVGNDSLVDTPTNYGTDTGVGGEVRGNYCTLNPLDNRAALPLQDGNLKAFAVAGGAHHILPSTFTITSGKWYWETTVIGTNNASTISTGLVYSPNKASGYTNLPASTADDGVSLQMTSTNSVWWNKNGSGQVNLTGMSFAANDVAQIAVDMDANKAWVGKNGTWFSATLAQIAAGTNQVNTGTLPNPGMPFAGCGTAIDTLVMNFGQRPFVHAVPSGFKALCTQNLPNPAIVQSSQYFDVNLRTGTGAPGSVTTLNFQPDLLWTKVRSVADDHHFFDSVRGTDKFLSIPATVNEDTADGMDVDFLPNGYDFSAHGGFNTAARTYVEWLWKKGATPGLDIVTYLGNGANGRTIAHALGVTPAFCLFRNRDVSGGTWLVYHSSIPTPSTNYLQMQVTAALGAAAGFCTPSSSQITFTTSYPSNNTNGTNYVAYLFADVPGFSRFGLYTGNGSADGPFVWCGFRPKRLMVKRTDTTGNWEITDSARDPNNVMVQGLYANLTNAEANTGGSQDFLSNGFKLRRAGADVNASGGTYVFAAFAEQPFKHARAERVSSSFSAYVPGPAATSFLVTVAPFVAAGLARTFTVQARAVGADTNNYTGTMHFTSTAGGATLPADATMVNGVGTFSATFPSAGTFTITATDTVVGTITGTSGNVVVSAVTPGSQTFTSVGTNNFTVPNFITMHIDLYGAGGAGGGSANSSPGSGGGTAQIASLGLAAGGGGGGPGAITGTPAPNGGAGGSGSGGNTNLSGVAGGAGGINVGGAGGAAAASGPGAGGVGGAVGSGGGGGGGGGYLRRTVTPAEVAPGSNLSIVVPGGGSPGGVGGGGSAGAAGGQGQAVVTWTNT